MGHMKRTQIQTAGLKFDIFGIVPVQPKVPVLVHPVLKSGQPHSFLRKAKLLTSILGPTSRAQEATTVVGLGADLFTEKI